MIYDGVKFILEDTVLSIAFTSAGEAFHISGRDIDIAGSVLTITGFSLGLSYKLYKSVKCTADIELLGLDIWADPTI